MLLLPDDDGDEGDDVAPLEALPLFLPYWLELEPLPALRLQAVMPKARRAAVRTAVTVFRFIASPLG